MSHHSYTVLTKSTLWLMLRLVNVTSPTVEPCLLIANRFECHGAMLDAPTNALPR